MSSYRILAAVTLAWSAQAAEQAVEPAETKPASVEVGGVLVQPRAPGIESPGYVWNEMKGEELLALKATGDPARGAETFIVCQGCHGADALGDATGYYPRLAGQHASVLIKQMVDVREGRRDNPKMFPYASEHVISTQEIADIAAYLHSLPSSPPHGVGPGGDMQRAAKIYNDDCEICHGRSGEGDGRKFYPKVADQHYAYLLRQAYDIRDGVRRNANPEMVEAIKPYSNADIMAVSDYMSRFPGAGK